MMHGAKPEKSGNSKAAADPYADAHGAWLERYGTYLQQAYNWRLIAMLEAISLVVAVVGIFYLAGQTKVVPYVVAIDRIGNATAVPTAAPATLHDPNVVKAELNRWIINSRSVVTDRIVALKMLNAVYDFLGQDSSAWAYVNDWYRTPGNSPIDRAKDQTVQVAVDAINSISDSSYDIQWTETIRDQHGKISATQQWTGVATIAYRPPVNEATAFVNPLGLYITSLSWTKKVNAPITLH